MTGAAARVSGGGRGGAHRPPSTSQEIKKLSGFQPHAPLIAAAELAARRADPDLVVLDATAPLPGETGDPADWFRDGHVPGARRFDLDLFSEPGADHPHTVPSATRFASLAGALGIGDDTTVVVTEGRRPFAAARAWFLFRLFGHDRVAVLDGGLPAWRAEGRAVETGDAAAVAAPRRFVPRLRNRLLVGLGDVLDGAGGALLLDARAAGRFDGTAPEPRPGLRSGAIPGSRNLPYGALLEADGRFRSAAALRALFAEIGATPDRRLVASCGTGVTAAMLLLGLAVAGMEGALFDGSWTEYARAVPA